MSSITPAEACTDPGLRRDDGGERVALNGRDYDVVPLDLDGAPGVAGELSGADADGTPWQMWFWLPLGMAPSDSPAGSWPEGAFDEGPLPPGALDNRPEGALPPGAFDEAAA